MKSLCFLQLLYLMYVSRSCRTLSINSEIWSGMCCTTVGFEQQSNGLVERENGFLTSGSMLGWRYRDHRHKWVQTKLISNVPTGSGVKSSWSETGAVSSAASREIHVFFRDKKRFLISISYRVWLGSGLLLCLVYCYPCCRAIVMVQSCTAV